MIAEIFSGNRKIIESDSVYLYDLEDVLTLCFMFKEKNFDVKISCTYDFLGRPVGMQIFVDSRELDAYIETNLIDRAIGTVDPVKIAEEEGKVLYVHIWSYRVSETVKKVEYTVYSSDE